MRIITKNFGVTPSMVAEFGSGNGSRCGEFCFDDSSQALSEKSSQWIALLGVRIVFRSY